MRSLKEYLTESAKKYDFRIKIACDCADIHRDVCSVNRESACVDLIRCDIAANNIGALCLNGTSGANRAE